MSSVKIIISNYSQLKLKYNASFPAILLELNNLLEIDKKRGISSKIVFVDSIEMRNKYGVSPVTDYNNEEQNKVAIDAIYNGEKKPDYLMIIGSIDVIPHQSLTNPVDESEITIPSDLPYACNKGYSKNILDFIGQNRVIGRLPDITGGSDSSYLIKLIRNIINFNDYTKEYYLNYIGACSSMFVGTTKKTIENVFDNYDSLLCSPPNDFNNLDKIMYNAPSQFYNCHGNSKIPFWGEPVANNDVIYLLKSSMLNKQLSQNTLIVTEACFGAELYNPEEAIIPETKNILPICNNMLKYGAVGFYGSTDTLYGEIIAGHQEQGDLITNFFLDNVINRNCSLGSASLEAQHQFINACKNGLTPYDQKTIAQCILLGDPSLHLVIDSSITKQNIELISERSNRRTQYSLMGNEVYSSSSFYLPLSIEKIPSLIKKKIHECIEKNKLINYIIVAYSKNKRGQDDKTRIEKADLSTVLYIVRGDIMNKNVVQKDAVLSILTKSDKVIVVKLYLRK